MYVHMYIYIVYVSMCMCILYIDIDIDMYVYIYIHVPLISRFRFTYQLQGHLYQHFFSQPEMPVATGNAPVSVGMARLMTCRNRDPPNHPNGLEIWKRCGYPRDMDDVYPRIIGMFHIFRKRDVLS